MATASKVSFRARNLDANKPMTVYYSQELPATECAPARSVLAMPTGMEKDEEMESHLQEAIISQQASTSGVKVDFVIPTPKVWSIADDRYNQIYPAQPPLNKHQYIKVQAFASLDQEEPDYDIDSEDEEWLSDRPHIDARTFEKIVDVLESQSSENSICLPQTAQTMLTHYNDDVVGDVYDYWLIKRTKAAKSIRNFTAGIGGLIPRVRTDCRKDAQGINPYVAFRRRAEKMQTRRNRKNDEDSYEKVLKLTYDLSKAHVVTEMLRRREETKAALIEMDAEIFARRMALSDFGSVLFNQAVGKNATEPGTSGTNGYVKSEDPAIAKKRKRFQRASRVRQVPLNREVTTMDWIEKNNEVWHMPPSVMNPLGISPILEVERGAKAVSDANQDGRYTFKRRRGCVYRAPLLPSRENTDPAFDTIKPENRVYPASLPAPDGTVRSAAMFRRRVGRGGRVVFDRVVGLVKEDGKKDVEARVPKIYHPFDDAFLEDSSLTFRPRHIPWDLPLVSERLPSLDDYEREKKWLASQVPSSSAAGSSGNDQPGRAAPTSEAPATNNINDRSSSKGSPATEDSREPSRSPSESTSSTEWVQASLGSRAPATDYALLPGSIEDARTGEHPLALHPNIRQKPLMGVTSMMIECATNYMMAPPPVGS